MTQLELAIKKLGDGHYGSLESAAEMAGVSFRETVVAALLYFNNNKAVDFTENPCNLEYRFPTDEEENALCEAHTGMAAFKNPKDLTSEELATELHPSD